MRNKDAQIRDEGAARPWAPVRFIFLRTLLMEKCTTFRSVWAPCSTAQFAHACASCTYFSPFLAPGGVVHGLHNFPYRVAGIKFSRSTPSGFR
jgi:hypothetical protein